MRQFRRLAGAIFLWVISCVAGVSIELGQWHLRYPQPPGAPRTLVHDGEKFVLADYYGNLLTSISARNWTVQPIPVQRSLHSMVHALNTFLVVGEEGLILSSTNGTNWVQIESPTTNNLSKVIFDGRNFVAVGDHGTIISGQAGGTFTLHDPIVTNHLWDVTGGNGALVAAGSRGTILVSTNLGEWNRATVEATNDFRSIAFFKGTFHNGWHSTSDPMQWTNQILKSPHSIIYSMATNTHILARSYGGYVETSAGGSSFSRVESLRGSYRLMTISNSFVALSGGIYFQGATGYSSVTPEQFYGFRRIVADTNGYVAYAAYPFTSLQSYFFSTNGESWRLRRTEVSPVKTNDLAFAAPPFARCRDGAIQLSENGTEWQTISGTPESPFYMQHAAALGGVVVASSVTDLWVTTNLWATHRTNWTSILRKFGPEDTSYGTSAEGGGKFPTYPWITSINARSNLLVATTSWGEVLLSTNGFDWEIKKTPLGPLEDATFTPQGLLVCSTAMIAETYFDGGPDEPMPFGFNVGPNQVTFDGPHGYYELQSSTNLSDWTTLQVTSTNVSFEMSLTNSQQYFRAMAPH